MTAEDFDEEYSAVSSFIMYMKEQLLHSALIVSMRRSTVAIIRDSIQYIRNYNLFSSIPPSTNPSELKSQIISTRVFIVSFVLSTGMLLFYTSIIPVTKSVTIKTPDLKVYLDLQNQYPETLICPCKHIAIQYDRFLQVNYTLHQVCSSDFVTNRWIDYLYREQFNEELEIIDFRIFGLHIFQGLRSLCALVDTTIKNSLTRVLADRYISIDVTSLVAFQLKSRILFNEFLSSSTNELLANLRINRDNSHANQFFSSLLSNAAVYIDPYELSLAVWALHYGKCECSSNSKCIAPLMVIKSMSPVAVSIVRGLFVGCYVIEALLQCTLECFYDRSCFDEVLSQLKYSSSINVTLLNASAKSRFNTTNTIEDLLNNLMVEQWHWSPTYANYFNECQSVECRYTYRGRNNLIYSLTTLIGLTGGLTTTLRLIVPMLVRLVRNWKRNSVASVADIAGQESTREISSNNPMNHLSN